MESWHLSFLKGPRPSRSLEMLGSIQHVGRGKVGHIRSRLKISP